jgi:putative transposase
MPRAHRHIEPGHTYHVTHRCHNRAFLFKFARDRQAYRTLLRERAIECGIALFNYTITSNHTHLLLQARNQRTETLSHFMQVLEGDFAQLYNRRKNRSGAFWEGRYHAGMIQDGPHLCRCMAYIDLNMVRAGVVGHPREWEWTGYNDLMGERRRNRLLDTNMLVRSLGAVGEQGLDRFRIRYREMIEEALARRELERQPMWTESIAVGDRAWAEQMGRQIRNRMGVRVEQANGNSGAWTIREDRGDYSTG